MPTAGSRWSTRFLVALSLCFGPPCLAQPDEGLLDREAVMRSAAEVTAAGYPDADDVLVDEHVRVVYQADGTSVTWDDEYVKVLTEKGKRAQRAHSLHFTLPYETVRVLRLEVIKPDGTVVPVDIEKQSRVMVDRSQMNVNIYNPNQKILSVSVPGIEVGDVCHMLSRRNEVKARVPDTWSDYSVFEYTTPLKRIVYEVTGPASLPLRHIALRDEVPGTVTAEPSATADTNVYRWEVRDVPRMFEEPNMPPLHTVVQRLLISTLPDWQTISRWYWNLCRPRLEAGTPEMNEKVAELTAGLQDDRLKMERIFQFVSQQIRYMGITTEEEAPGYEPHDVKTTFLNRYGVCRDKGALLVAMLRLAGFEAYPVLIHNGPKKDSAVPQPYFNHAVVGVADGAGAYVLMDPTDENTTELWPSYLDDKSYLVAHPEGESLRTSPITPADRNLLRIQTTGKLDATGTLKADTLMRFEGINDNVYRGYFSRIRKEERRSFFEGLVRRRVAGAVLEDFDLMPADLQDTTQLLSARLSYSATDFPVGSDDYTMLTLPWIGTAAGFVNFVIGKTGLETRRYPLSTEVACGVVETLSLELGDSVGAAISVPGATAIETNAMVFRLSMDVASNRLEGASDFRLNTVEFSPSEYLALKDVLKDMEFARRRQPVFQTAPHDHDARILSERTRIELRDAHHWVETQTVRKHILTYGGKKANAELKVAYNPAWETVSLQRASVTNANGTVHAVAPEEMNVMDAAWVGAAPRYPAEKTLVISLPGVEAGSVIDYEISRESTGKPFFSLARSFRGHDPVVDAALEIVAPASLGLKIQDDTGGTVEYCREEADGQVIHRWTTARQDSILKEDGLPPWWAFTPTVFVSAGDWASYARTVGAQLQAAAADRTRSGERARLLTAGQTNRESRVRAIRDDVARSIRAAGPSLPLLPLSSVTAADRTLDEGYGNTTDRAVLLYAMLAEAGAEPEFVLAASSTPRIESVWRPVMDVSQRDVLDEVLVRVRLDDDRWIYLNDADQYAALGATSHDGRPGLTLDGEPLVIRAGLNLEDHAETEYHVRILEDGGAVISVTNRIFGTEFGRFHRLYAELSPEERRRHYREMLGELSQAAEPETDLVTDYGSYPGIRSFTARVEPFAVRSGDYLYFSLPESRQEKALPLRADRRRHPFFADDPMRLLVRYRIELPDNVAGVGLMPGDVRWEAPDGFGRVSCQTSVGLSPAGHRTIEIRREISLESALVSPGNYASLVTMSRDLNHPDARTVMVLLEPRGADAP